MKERYEKIIEEICQEENIKTTFLSKDWIIKLEKEGKTKYIMGYKFPSNNQTSGGICNDKYATYCVLKDAQIPVMEHKLIYNKKIIDYIKSDIETKKDLKEYLKENKKLVVKDTIGTCGKMVYLCSTYGEVKRKIKRIFKRRENVIISPYYEIDTEYRVIWQGEKEAIIYGKHNSEKSWKHNLAQGAKAEEIKDEKLKKKLCEIAQEVTKQLELKFVSVDIAQIKSGELLVIEVNSGVMIDKLIDQIENGYERAKAIYKSAIEEMFK